MRTFCQVARVAALLLLTCATFLRAEEPTAKEEEPTRDLVFERLETLYRFQNDGTGEVTQLARCRVQSEAGRTAVAQIAASYSSELEDLRFDYVRTLKPDGTQVVADPSQAQEVTSPVARVAPMFSDARFKIVPVPKLEVGDAVEYQFTKTIRVPLKPGDFWTIHYPTRNAEVLSELVVLDCPAERKLSLKADPQSPFTTENKPGRKLYRWELTNPHPQKRPASPPKPLFAVSTLSRWEQVGQWYLELQSSRTGVTQAIQALATGLTAGKTAPREKLEAVYRYVSEQIRYVGIMFGMGGFQPHSAADVLRNGYGDCKDKHALLTALLEAAGLRVYPVLVNTEQGLIEPAVPMPAQFNHVISMVPIADEEIWLDTTLEVAPLGVLPMQMRGKQALLLDPGHTRIADIPALSPVPESQRLTMNGKLEATGKLTLHSRVELRGTSEIIYRQIFRLGNKEVVSAAAKRLARMQVAGAEAEEPTSSQPLALSQPFSFQYRLSASNYIQPLEKRTSARIPALLLGGFAWKEALQDIPKSAEKEESPPKQEKPEDIKLGGPSEYEETFDLEVDPSIQVDLPMPIRVERSFGVYESQYALEEGRLRVRRNLKMNDWKLSPERKAELASFQKLMDRDLAQTALFCRTTEIDSKLLADALTADELNEAGTKALESGNPAMARDLLETATAKDPKHKYAWNNLGRAYARLGQDDQAEQALKKQIEVNPEDESAYNNLGSVYRNQRRYEEAIAAFKKQLEINPLDQWAYPNLGETYSEMGKSEEAIQAYEKAISIDRDRSYLHAGLGQALLKAGKVDEARSRFARALELSKDPSTLNNVAYALAEARVDLDKAQEYAQSAVNMTASALEGSTLLQMPALYAPMLSVLGSYLDTLGWVLFQKGQLEEAAPFLLLGFDLTQHIEIAEHLTKLFARLDNSELAVRYFAYTRQHLGAKAVVPKELEEHAQKKLGGLDGLGKRVGQFDEREITPRQVRPPDPSFTWPSQAAKLEQSVKVRIRILVDDTGAVTDSEVLSGDEPFRSAALADLHRIHLPPLAWPGRAIKSVRTVEFEYVSSKTISARWEFANESLAGRQVRIEPFDPNLRKPRAGGSSEPPTKQRRP